MKVDARGVDRFLADPGACRVVLFYGEDAGLIHERADQMTRRVAGSLDDAFRVASLGRETHDRLEEEATALSLTGGRRVVRVRDPVETVLAPIERALRTPSDTLIIVEAGSLAPRSKLRSTLEGRQEAAVIACYLEEGRQLAASLREMIAREGCRIEADALAALADQLGSDRAAARGEVEKLVLYAGDARAIDLAAVEACVSDASALSLDDALHAATAGEVAAADRAIERAIADGANPVQIARSMLYHVHKLRDARLAMEQQRLSPADAIRTVRPPVFFKRADAFRRALGVWTVAQLEDAARMTNRVEIGCKQTGAPDALLCRNLVMTVALEAASRG